MGSNSQFLFNYDGSSTEIKIFSADNPTHVFILQPAMGVFAKYYQPLAETMVNTGFAVVLADLRGNDTSSIRPKRGIDFGYKEMLEQDFESVVNFVSEKYESLPIYLFGHSLGGQLSCLYASKQPSKVNGLILSATCSVYYGGWNGPSRYQILAGTQFANLVAGIMGFFPGKKVGFGGTEARTVIKDWSRQSRTGIYRISNDEFDYEKALSELAIPVLSVSYEGDNLAPKGAVEHLLQKMKSAQIEHIHLERNDPRNDGFNHFNWAKKPQKIVEMIQSWSGLG